MADGAAGKVFINYRQGDDPSATGRLYDRLEPEPGKSWLDMPAAAQLPEPLRPLGRRNSHIMLIKLRI